MVGMLSRLMPSVVGQVVLGLPVDGFRSIRDVKRGVLSCADPLRQVAQEHPGVSIGSYPNVAQCTDTQTFRVRLQIESRDKEALDAAVAAVTAAVQCIPQPVM